MLEYEWGGNPTTMILPTTGDEQQEHHHQDNGHPDRHHYFHPSNTNPFNPQEVLMPAGATLYQQQPVNVNPFYDPRAYTMGPTPSFLAAPPPAHSSSHSGYFLVPKAEEQTQTTDRFASRIGLNLGGRTYFSSAEDDFVNRLYRRSRPLMMDQAGISSAAVARCQAEGCNADLTHAKHYHRRHKVCEFHSKASTVIAHGLTQRFCQQCSRFHLLPEFDNGKRSCRKRLADHNRRRRKSNNQTTGGDNHQDISGRHCKSPPPLQHESARNSPSDHLIRSPPGSGVHSPSSVTVALSPPRMSLDCFKQRPYHQASNTATITTSASSPASSSSFFFSSG